MLASGQAKIPRLQTKFPYVKIEENIRLLTCSPIITKCTLVKENVTSYVVGGTSDGSIQLWNLDARKNTDVTIESNGTSYNIKGTSYSTNGS